MILPDFFEVQFGWIDHYPRKAGYSSHFPVTLLGAEPYRVLLVKSGHIVISTDQQRWQLCAGSVLFLPPSYQVNQYHVRAIQDSEFLAVGFRLLLFGSIDMTQLLHRPLVWHPARGEFDALLSFMQVLLQISPQPSFAERLVRDGAIHTILGICWNALGGDRFLEEDNPQMPPWLHLVMQELRHFPGMSVTDLERLTGYSHAKFYRLFQQFFGVSPRNYLQRYRLDLAKHLLTTTEMSVAAISEHLGFTNAPDFARFFRRMCLITPTEYRQTTAQTGQDLPA